MNSSETVQDDSKSKQKNAFKLLQIALATLATKNGWTIEPSSE